MSAQDRIPPPEQLDGFLDGELSPVERSAVEAHLAEHREAQQLLEQQRQMRQWIRQSVTQKAEEAAANVDFDRLTQRIMQGIQKPVVALAKEEAPIAVPVAPWKATPTTQEEPRPSLWDSVILWLRAHPVMSVAAGSFAVVLLVVAVPFWMDPGPAPNDCVVDEAAGSKRSQVAVLQTQNKATGQEMTVIVVDEPDPLDDQDTEPNASAKKAPRISNTGNAPTPPKTRGH